MPITKTYYKVHRAFPDPDYFYMENISGSSSPVYVKKNGTPASTDLAYSLDKVTWTDIHNGGVTSTVANGAKVYFRSSTGFSSGNWDYYSLNFGSNDYEITRQFNVGGHIATLINYLNVESTTFIPNYSFCKLFNFNNGTRLVHANIDFYGIKSIGEYGCYEMFKLCQDLITIPDFSSVNSIASGSFNSAFQNCTSLTTPADISNVTTWSNYTLSDMYNSCSSLTEAIAPNVLSWTTNNTQRWLENTAATGVVRKPAGLTIPTNNVSGVPTGWTTEDY